MHEKGLTKKKKKGFLVFSVGASRFVDVVRLRTTCHKKTNSKNKIDLFCRPILYKITQLTKSPLMFNFFFIAYSDSRYVSTIYLFVTHSYKFYSDKGEDFLCTHMKLCHYIRYVYYYSGRQWVVVADGEWMLYWTNIKARVQHSTKENSHISQWQGRTQNILCVHFFVRTLHDSNPPCVSAWVGGG